MARINDVPSDRRANLALRLAPLAMVAVFGLVGADLLLFETAVAVSLAAAVWVVYELHDHQRALDEYQLQAVQDPTLWPQLEAHEAAGYTTDLSIDSRFG
ncbi:MAG TPA: hypothetical protein VF107_07580 [Burkholderiaceae bacterium]